MQMFGLDPKISMHRLFFRANKRLIKQMNMDTPPHGLKLEAQADKNTKALFIREAHYPSWLVNIVPYGRFRICINFKDLTKLAPKDDFPVPHTGLLVDTTTGFEALMFMDGYS